MRGCNHVPGEPEYITKGRGGAVTQEGYFPELAAIFLTMASTSLRSLSLRLVE